MEGFSSKPRGRTSVVYSYFCLNCASTARGSPSSTRTLPKTIFQTECRAAGRRTNLESNVVVPRTNILLLQPTSPSADPAPGASVTLIPVTAELPEMLCARVYDGFKGS